MCKPFTLGTESPVWHFSLNSRRTSNIWSLSQTQPPSPSCKTKRSNYRQAEASLHHFAFIFGSYLIPLEFHFFKSCSYLCFTCASLCLGAFLQPKTKQLLIGHLPERSNFTISDNRCDFYVNVSLLSRL